jgi:transposase
MRGPDFRNGRFLVQTSAERRPRHHRLFRRRPRRIFETYVETQLAPTLKPGDVVVLDNLPAHKSPAAEKAIRAKDAWLLFLPPYSPDLNPIEMAFAKLKALLRARAVRTIDALWRAIGEICDLFSLKSVKTTSTLQAMDSLEVRRSSSQHASPRSLNVERAGWRAGASRKRGVASVVRHSDQAAIQGAAAVIIKVADRYSNAELDTVLMVARRASESNLKDTSAEANVARTLIETIDAARFMLRNRA